ncbi:MAG: ABC transporter ATP-binding protein [Anaerolineae bacterium]|uniref:ABC transporter ATP-binding protein n=1 Tax=Thermoflexus sp. TaxID=1969742 RepID=UPI0025F6B9EF|nr:ABC transporter ATP-binding protein [Thermoflexus sp.]MCS7352002.1 ABC transporter ATP-binding protein [Thermoflexus sp.]MDW8181461.1 ABC transporter ATP-binding protein [Anaerolineae bacterium]
MIEVERIWFGYGGQWLFRDFSWSVARGEAWAIIGPSGCGKTTLLYLLAGLRQPQRGAIRIDGQPLQRPRPRTGLILQDYGLLPWATVWENVALGLRIRRFYGPDGRHAPVDAPVADIAGPVNAWLERLGLAAVRDRYPGQISGGQRQRTAIARALVLKPDLLLMDEPFASLDAPTREDLQELTWRLKEAEALTLILVTHNIEEAVFMGQRILILGAPPHTRPEVVENPGAGDPSFRQARAYWKRVEQLRQALRVPDARG